MKKEIDLFECISPLDYRYYGRNEELKKALGEFLSENAKVFYQAKVEEEFVKTLARKKVCPCRVALEVSKAVKKIKPAGVYEEEDRIKHEVRALVNKIRENVSDDSKRYVHLGLTSYDVVDTANMLRYKLATEKVIIPYLKRLEKALITVAKREKSTVQVGRTHGQFASPVTFGFAMAEYVERLGERILAVEKASDALAGKFSGGVGASNALALVYGNPAQLEKETLERLGLKTARHSTQIVPREPMLDLVHALVSAFGVMANLADDFRHLQRSEISEVYEAFGKEQVGSSTMPHKRNPITFENVKSLWKEFMPRAFTLYMDQISEHQRDLSNSASSRFIPEIFVALAYSADKMAGAIERLKVDRKKMKENLSNAENMIAAEPLYVLLAEKGHPGAHEAVRKLTLNSEKTGKPLMALAADSKALRPYLDRMSRKELALLGNPASYLGIAEKRTVAVCRHWKKELKI